MNADRNTQKKVDPVPNPVGHFLAPRQPFWILQVLIEGINELNKKLFSWKLIWGYNNKWFNLFTDIVIHFGLSRRSGVLDIALLQTVRSAPSIIRMRFSKVFLYLLETTVTGIPLSFIFLKTNYTSTIYLAQYESKSLELKAIKYPVRTFWIHIDYIL